MINITDAPRTDVFCPQPDVLTACDGSAVEYNPIELSGDRPTANAFSRVHSANTTKRMSISGVASNDVERTLIYSRLPAGSPPTKRAVPYTTGRHPRPASASRGHSSAYWRHCLRRNSPDGTCTRFVDMVVRRYSTDIEVRRGGVGWCQAGRGGAGRGAKEDWTESATTNDVDPENGKDCRRNRCQAHVGPSTSSFSSSTAAGSYSVASDWVRDVVRFRKPFEATKLQHLSPSVTTRGPADDRSGRLVVQTECELARTSGGPAGHSCCLPHHIVGSSCEKRSGVCSRRCDRSVLLVVWLQCAPLRHV